ncbi:MAG: tRNA (adenosine(37)-N6)-dimethylallyltransferase MiaA [Bacteroidales bacterium]|nr:tRNA (adenosine(37)-N6)-dimethylallyltransferase MiaA [Bacteroidales bacterium]
MKTLLVITGPTAVGKTRAAIVLAKQLNAEIISCDSRQMYREMRIGTAVPSPEELSEVPHHFIGNLSIQDYYNVSLYEQDVLNFLSGYFQNKETAVVTGGSGLYLDALCHGIDDLPFMDIELRQDLTRQFQENGIEWLRSQLKLLDPVYYARVDLQNHQRLLKAVEVCLQTGQPYSSLLTRRSRPRPFRVVNFALNRDREDLTKRIRTRVDHMMTAGLLEEARSLYPYKDLNALKTVGYKELFDYIEHKYSLEEAIEKIKVNTRRYAKRQITWLKRDPDFQWFHPEATEDILKTFKSISD